MPFSTLNRNLRDLKTAQDILNGDQIVTEDKSKGIQKLPLHSQQVTL